MIGDCQCVDLLLQRHIDVNKLNSYYETALQAVSRVGGMNVIERLFKTETDVNIFEDVHDTALRAAVIGGHENVIDFLILHGVNIHLCYDKQDMSILHLTLETRSYAIFKLLLAADADVNNHFFTEQSIVILAFQLNDAMLIELLHVNETNVNEKNSIMTLSGVCYNIATPLYAACEKDHESIVRLLLVLETGIENMNQRFRTSLQAVILRSHLSIVRLLLDSKTNVNHDLNDTPLSETSRDGKFEIVKELLNFEACVDDASKCCDALAKTCIKDQHAIIELLIGTLSRKGNESRIYSDAFHAAIQSHRDGTGQLLLEFGLTSIIESLLSVCAIGLNEIVRMLLVKELNVRSFRDEKFSFLARCSMLFAFSSRAITH